MFLYTALGDSITAGAGAVSWQMAYPSLIVRKIQHAGTSRPKGAAACEVLAYPGWTSADLEDAVFENSDVYLRQACAVSIWVGGDDLAYAGISMLHGAPKSIIARSLERYRRSLTGLVAGVRRVSTCRIILCTQYNPFPNSPLATEGITALNVVTQTVAVQHGAVLAPAHAWFAGRQRQLIRGYRRGLLEDVLRSPVLPIHPNNLGHRVIAQGMTPLVAGSPA